MKDPRRTCPKGLHTPQNHYFWENGKLGIHCAACGGDYTIPEKQYDIIKYEQIVRGEK